MELVITSSPKTLHYWKQRPYLNEETKHLLSDVDVLIVPDEDLREFKTPLFPSNMMEIYDTLKEHFNVEAAINDEDYHELSLNSKKHRFGIYAVTLVVAPLFVTILGNYISEKLKHEDPTDEIELEILLDNNSEHSKSIKYQGTAEDFKKVADKVIELSKEKDEHRTDTAKSASAVHKKP